MKVSVKIPKNATKKAVKNTQRSVQQSIKVIAQDLARTSSETAPHWSGVLEKSYTITYSMGPNRAEATIRVSAKNDGFDYAIAMHEWTYNLGPRSEKKPGGTGMSGTTYEVGRKYLTRVLEGESVTYSEYIADFVSKNLK